MPPGSRTDKPGRVKRRAHGRLGVWAVAAVACVAAGTVGSLLAARSTARNNAAEARREFHQTSGAIASTLKLAIKHEEDLAVGTSTYFAGNPSGSAAAFEGWARWAHVLGRYPELERLDLIALKKTPESAVSRNARLHVGDILGSAVLANDGWGFADRHRRTPSSLLLRDCCRTREGRSQIPADGSRPLRADARTTVVSSHGTEQIRFPLGRAEQRVGNRGARVRRCCTAAHR